jgi:hypothetical protein
MDHLSALFDAAWAEFNDALLTDWAAVQSA